MDEDGPLADVVHGGVEDKVEPRVVVLAEVVDSEEDRVPALVSLPGLLDVALDEDVERAASLGLDDVGVEAGRVRHLEKEVKDRVQLSSRRKF